MWSLPKISQLNAQAVAEHRKRRGRSPSPRGKKCDSCGKKAKELIPYHDLFGDEKTRQIPKGYIVTCQECRDSGRAIEGYFECDSCGRTMVEYYTWERYVVDTHDGGEGGDEPQRTCLACAFEEEICYADPGPWIYQEDVIRLEDAIADGQHDAALDWIREKVKHLIGVETEYWQEWLILHDGVTVDNATGGTVRGFSSCDSGPAASVREIIGHLKAALEIAPRCALILDGGYQFCVSLGIYYEVEFAQAELGQAGVREARA